MKKIFLCLALVGCELDPEVGLEEQVSSVTVTGSTLFQQLWGFGKYTTGGLGGQVYTVLYHDADGTGGDPDDANRYGTLRYGVERLRGPRWIVFDAAAFPATTKRSITMTSQFRFDPNRAVDGDITIDGRGSYVSLRRDVLECTSQTAPIIDIVATANIILTHLDFERTYPSGWDWDMKEDCGDIVTVNNKPNKVDGIPQCPTGMFDRIWINQSNFRDCGDECIGMSHFSCDGIANITISRNQFIGTGGEHDMGILLGHDNNDFDQPDTSYEVPAYGIAATLYQNRFYNIRTRTPRLTHGYVRAYNNVFENWQAYSLHASDYSRMMIEHNVFRSSSSSLKDNAWVYYDCSDGHCTLDSAAIWARKNHWWTFSTSSTCPTPPGGSGTGACNTTSFPACPTGGPWYYDCNEVWPRGVRDLSAYSYTTALDYLRSLAGWKSTSNDVRDMTNSQ